MMLHQVSQQWVTCGAYLAKELTVNSSPDLAGTEQASLLSGFHISLGIREE